MSVIIELDSARIMTDRSTTCLHAEVLAKDRRPDDRSFVDGELLAQGQVFESELPMAAKEEGHEPKQVE